MWVAMAGKTDPVWRRIQPAAREKSPMGMSAQRCSTDCGTWTKTKTNVATRMATAAVIREQLLKAERYLKDTESAASEDGDEPEFDIKSEALAAVLTGEIQAHFHALGAEIAL